MSLVFQSICIIRCLDMLARPSPTLLHMIEYANFISSVYGPNLAYAIYNCRIQPGDKMSWRALHSPLCFAPSANTKWLWEKWLVLIIDIRIIIAFWGSFVVGGRLPVKLNSADIRF